MQASVQTALRSEDRCCYCNIRGQNWHIPFKEHQDHDGEDACLFFERVLIVLLFIGGVKVAAYCLTGQILSSLETARNRKQSFAEAIGDSEAID
jgi:hypothetical protein